MRLIRFGGVGHEKPGVLTEDGVRKDCSPLFLDWDADFFREGGLETLSQVDVDELKNVPPDERWGACVARPGKIICVAGNYRAHCEESNAKVASEPVVFMKATSSLSGPYDPIVIPKDSVKTDYEVELAVVIGHDARYLGTPEDAETVIAGYTICNDVSEREFQAEHCGQHTKGKSCDTFCPLGPALVTPDQIPDLCDLTLKTLVNGEQRQRASTRDMECPPAKLVHYLSRFMTLEAGDVISTGTPSGVGGAMDPPQFLREGDVVELSIQTLGGQRQVCRSFTN